MAALERSSAAAAMAGDAVEKPGVISSGLVGSAGSIVIVIQRRQGWAATQNRLKLQAWIHHSAAGFDGDGAWAASIKRPALSNPASPRGGPINCTLVSGTRWSCTGIG